MSTDPHSGDLENEEWAEWYRLTPQERWRETERLWQFYLSVGGSLDPAPIRKVLSTLATRQVRYLLMGGQACVLYGGAEFSRDTDITVLAARTTGQARGGTRESCWRSAWRSRPGTGIIWLAATHSISAAGTLTPLECDSTS